MDIVTLAAARKGSGGGASKEYVDEKVAALINDTTAAQNKTYSSAKVEEKVEGEEITTTSTTSPVTTAQGKPRKITIFGKSEIVDNDIRSAGEGWATVDLGTLSWTRSDAGTFTANITDMKPSTSTAERIQGLICAKYQLSSSGTSWDNLEDKHIQKVNQVFGIKDLSYNNATAFKTAMSGVILCYELADPTQADTIAVKADNGTGIDGTMGILETGTPLRGITGGAMDVALWDGTNGKVIKRCEVVNGEVVTLANPVEIPFTTAENNSFARLETYAPQTHFTNNANTNMTIEAYAGTANGQAVNELKQDVQSEISALKITQSNSLTLTVADWSSNQQTVTYAHDTSKRNVIDVDPASVEEWASCGVMAISETATGITFKCSTVPENALTFRVTSMGVN